MVELFSAASATNLSAQTLTNENDKQGSKLHIFLDCDPGSDDCFLLAMLFQVFKNHQQDVEIIGLSASYGNSSAAHTLSNLTSMVTILHMEKYNLNIYKGAEEPLVRNDQMFTPTFIHGENGIGDVKELEKPNLSLCKGKITANNLLKMLKNIKESELSKNDKVIFISTGPFTLLAELILQKPEIKFLIDKLIVMGGTFESERGNCNDVMTSEFNIFLDPNAANVLFMDPVLKKKSIIFPLNVTHKAIVDNAQVSRFSQSNRKDKEITTVKRSFLKLIHKFSELYMSSNDNQNHQFDEGPPMHDVLTIMPIIEYLNAECTDNAAHWKFKELDFMVEIEGLNIGKTHILNSDTELKTFTEKSLLDYEQKSCVVVYDMNFSVFWYHFQNLFDQIDEETYRNDRI